MGLTTTTIPSAGELRKIREDLGLSQTELAAALGFRSNGAHTIRRWESDEEFRPTPLAWAALRYLVGIEQLYRRLGGADRELARSFLPEQMR